jgi:small-conductance mechanosensitive channel
MNHLGLDMNNVFGTITPQLMNIVAVLLILIIGMWVAKAVRNLAAKGLSKFSFLTVKTGSKPIDLVKPIASLIYYVILLNVLLIVLGKLGLSSVLDPLKNMAN